MKDFVVLCSSELDGQPIEAGSVVDSIIKGLGRFGKSLGALAQGLIDKGYNVERVTRGPESTVWQLGNDEYRNTKGESGYLCEVILKPHPVQTPGQPATYSLEIRTIKGLNEHSFVAENVTQETAGNVIRQTLSAWDAADNKTASSIKEQYDMLVQQAKDFVSEVKSKCSEAKQKVKSIDESNSLSTAIDDLQRQATDSTEDLSKYFQRAFRDAKTTDEKLQQCTKMQDSLEDNQDTFKRALNQILGESDESEDNAAEMEGQETEQGQEESVEFDTDMNPNTSGDAESQIPSATKVNTSHKIVACVYKHKDGSGVVFDLQKITASEYSPEEVVHALETVLYDSAVQDSISDDAVTVVELTDEDADWDVNILPEMTSVDMRKVFNELLCTYYKAYFNLKTIQFNTVGDAGSLLEMILRCEDEIHGQIETLSTKCVEQTSMFANPLTYLSGCDCACISDTTQYSFENGPSAVQSVIDSIITCLNLYRCNFDGYLGDQMVAWVDIWYNEVSTVLSRFQMH